MRSGLSSAEALAVTVVTFLAVLIAAAYLLGRVGITIHPAVVLGIAVLAAGVVFRRVRASRLDSDVDATIALIGVVVVVATWSLWMAWPSLLPVASGSDLAHHLLLIDYLEQYWRLPDATLGAQLGEMAHYTPGLHLLAAIGGALTATDGLHAVHPVLTLLVALKAAFVFLIALRLVPTDVPRIPVALIAVVMLFVARTYFAGGFMEDSFLAQVAAECFAVAMWWALMAWDQMPSRRAAILCAIAGVATFLTWPIWIGPVTLVFCAVVVAQQDLSWKQRRRHALAALGPIAVVAATHMAGRVEWFGIAATSGAVVRPSLAVFGWPLVLLGTAGFIVATKRQTRTLPLLIGAILLQAIALLVVASLKGAQAPYMALKMFYLLVYPLAVSSTLAVAAAWQTLRRHSPTRDGTTQLPSARDNVVAWLLLAILVIAVGRTFVAPHAAKPVVSNDLYDAGRWVRANLPVTCVDYIVASEYTAYWLHLVVLRNVRASDRSKNDNTFLPYQTIARWIVGDAPPYAIADLRVLPAELRKTVDVIAEFGTAAVIKTRAPAFCDEQFALRPTVSKLAPVRRNERYRA